MPIPTDGSGYPPIVLPDSSVYYHEAGTQGNIAWIMDDGFLYGENHIITVAVVPVLYSPSLDNNDGQTDRLSFLDEIRLELDYDIDGSTAPGRLDAKRRNEGVLLAQSMVKNPGDVVSNLSNGQSLGRLLSGGGLDPFDPGMPGPGMNEKFWPPYEYQIITSEELKPSLKRFEALKRQMGYSTGIVTMEDIMANPFAMIGDNVDGHIGYTDSAGILRQYLRIVHGRYAKFAFLVGATIPYRYAYQNYITLPTDLYYSDLTADWSIGGFDKNPELYIGRLIAKSKDQVSNYTDKLFRYVFNPGHGDRSYLKRALYTEGVDMIGHSDTVRAFMDNICPNVTTISEQMWQNFPTGSYIINDMSSTKYGFLTTFNHGGPSAIICYGFDSGNDPNVYQHRMKWVWAIDSVKIYNYYNAHTDPETGNGLNKIENKWYPSIYYSISCSTMPFDVLPTFEQIPMNYGESFTTGKDYGGPAYIGNTREGYIRKSAQLEKEFAKQLNNGYYKIGVAEALSKLYYVNSTYSDYLSCTHNLLGDPDLEMWTDIPADYSNITIVRTDSSIMVNGIDAESTIISYCSNNRKVGSDMVSVYSFTIHDVSPNSTVMLRKHNHIPYIAPLVLQNAIMSKSQYVIASDVTAGNSVDSGRTSGDVTIKSLVDYEIEATGTVTLEDGFKVEKGATFAVHRSCLNEY